MYPDRKRPHPGRQATARTEGGGPSALETALELARRGFSVVPQLPGAKQPCIRWKPFQDVAPVPSRIALWFEEFPRAGIALILGPTFGLFVVDVDGPDAHQALLAQLGSVPEAPTVLSGSLKPHRYHLYFRHPVASTQATFHPWHPQLEFRGYRGIVVAPPSLHKSGNRYRWAEGRSLDDLPLPEVPGPVLEALAARGRSGARASVAMPKPTCLPTQIMPPSRPERPRTPARVRDVALAKQALRHLGPPYYDDYSEWVRVGMALSGMDEDGLNLWRAWSEQSEKYDADALEDKWASFGRDAAVATTKMVGLGTLFYLATQEGWEHPSNVGAVAFRPAGFKVALPWLSPEQGIVPNARLPT